MSAEETATEPSEAPSTLFQPDASEAEAPAPETSERPEWLLDKFNSPEDQAKAYSDLYGAYSKKTEDMRAEIKAEAAEDYAKSLGVPDDIDGYTYPEGFEAPDGEIDLTLKEWAKANNVGKEAFETLISDVYSKTQVNFEAEREKLGEHADTRISRVNKWITKNVDEAHFEKVSKVMQDATGVEFFEHLMKRSADRGFAPDDLGTSTPQKTLTRDGIRKMQADPRFGDDNEYTDMVRGQWQAFAKQQEAAQRQRR